MSDKTREKLATCYASIVHDILRARGMKNFTLPKEIVPLMPEKRLCGPVFTIEGRIDETADPHETLLAWRGLLSKAKSGPVWLSQPHNHIIAQMGELSAETLQKKGVLGCVLDGGIRDTDFLLKIGFQSWARFHTPRDLVGIWLPTGFDVPIHIGDVYIRPGDYLLGDRDGMVRIPCEIVEEITDQSIEAMQTENKVRTAILEGMDPQEAYLAFRKF